jgi:FkbM family methyltransferase
MDLTKRVKKLGGLMLAVRRVRSSHLPEPLRSEVANTLWKLGLASNLPSTVSIVGYEVLHHGQAQLSHLFNEVFVEACYLFQADTDRPSIFDCGSNIGMSILFFKKLYPKARIVGFEPDPLTFDTRKKNMDQNALSDVAVHRLALGARDETRKFFRATEPNTSDLTMSLLKQRNDGCALEVECRRLSGFITDRIDLLKIDVEGAEQEVLDDLVDSGKLRFVEQMHLEYHHHIDTSVDTLSRMLRLLEDGGFGYQIQASSWPLPIPYFQDISIFCYRTPSH